MTRARENADGARLDAPLASPAITGGMTVVGSADNAMLEGLGIDNTDWASGETGQSVAINMRLKQNATMRDAGRITVGKDDDWDDASASDSHMSFKVASNDTLTEPMKISANGVTTFTGPHLSFPESGTAMTHSGVSIDANTTTLIQGGSSGRGSFAIVWGYTGGQRWIDYLLVGRTSVSVQASFSFYGSAPSRSYTCTNYTALNLNTDLASAINVVSFFH